MSYNYNRWLTFLQFLFCLWSISFLGRWFLHQGYFQNFQTALQKKRCKQLVQWSFLFMLWLIYLPNRFLTFQKLYWKISIIVFLITQRTNLQIIGLIFLWKNKRTWPRFHQNHHSSYSQLYSQKVINTIYIMQPFSK